MLPSAAQAPKKKAVSSANKLQPYVETLPKSLVKIKMQPIPGGSITIGGKKVAVKPFWMAQTETSWEAFDAFYFGGEHAVPYDQTQFGPDVIVRPSKSYILPDLGWGHNGWPAINVSYLSTQMFTRWLAKETGKKYRLPTEAEWEWACRGGKTGTWKVDKAALEKFAWYSGNSKGTAHPVGKKAPNAYGLHDMLGNPGEWATDLEGKPVLCGPTFQDDASQVAPTVRRRWSPKWQEHDPQFPKSRWWLANGEFVGFRIVREP
jgi:formylglycine-generating enzyme required for sulfatase activity